MNEMMMRTLALCLSTLLLPAQVLAADYWIKAVATITGPYTVDVDIETNLPDSALLAADLSLQDQDPQDVAIGTSFVRVPVSDGRAQVTIDGRENPAPHGSDLPAATYDVEVAFHPLWSENKATAADLGITDSIRYSTPVTLEASGTNPETIIEFHKGRAWVINNIYGGAPWDMAALIERFGNVVPIEYTGPLNPRIIKTYYIESIDMTFMINAVRGEYVTWADGKTPGLGMK